MEEEGENGTLKDSQKAPEKGQGAQQLEGKAGIGFELPGGGEEWIVGSPALKGSSVCSSEL